MNEFGLSALLGNLSLDKFLSDSWPKKYVFISQSKEAISELTSLPFLQSLEKFLQFWPESVQAHLPDVADESNSITCSTKDANKLFLNKMSLLFNNAEKFSPKLQAWLDKIHCELGLPHSTHSRCMIYATPRGAGTALHFDQNINFVLQLSGTKKWWLSPNSHVQSPTQRHTLGQPVDPELASYADSEFSDDRKLPMDKTTLSEPIEVTLRPGSVLFVPRGYWHCTEAQDDALALNFTFSQPTWADLFTMALRSRLLLSPEWRELADGVNPQNIVRRDFAEKKLDQLLFELVDDLPMWRAEGILSATEGE